MLTYTNPYFFCYQRQVKNIGPNSILIYTIVKLELFQISQVRLRAEFDPLTPARLCHLQLMEFQINCPFTILFVFLLVSQMHIVTIFYSRLKYLVVGLSVLTIQYVPFILFAIVVASKFYLFFFQ